MRWDVAGDLSKLPELFRYYPSVVQAIVASRRDVVEQSPWSRMTREVATVVILDGGAGHCSVLLSLR